MDRAEQIREILSARGLTLYRVSQQSAQMFGRSSRFHVPHNLYYDLADPSLAPTIHQVLALSHITNYRLSDWLAVFGFDLDLIFRLRLLISRRQTTLLDSTIYDTQAWIPWFAARELDGPVPPIAPLGHFLASTEPRRAARLLALNKKRFHYGKVGEEDAHALPHFAPGSIVRVDAQRADELLSDAKTREEKPFFLVEHEFGSNCAQLVRLGKDRVLLHSPQRPCEQRELRLGREARIVGVIDAEIRPVGNHGKHGWISLPVARQRPQLLPASNQQTHLKVILRNSRIKLGLSFREASSASRWMANLLSDELYFAAASTLSDYETLAAPPRHIQKILTLCVLYSIEFRQFLRASGLPLDREGQDPMPDELVRRRVPGRSQRLGPASEEESPREDAGFLGSLFRQWQEIPFFLRHALDEITGLKNFSPSDVYWMGGEKTPNHPWLINAPFVVVNRRVKRPTQSAEHDACDQRLYLILKRDGSYLCGRCTLDKGSLDVPGYPGGPVGSQRFKNGIDAEVVGQVTTILRRLTN